MMNAAAIREIAPSRATVLTLLCLVFQVMLSAARGAPTDDPPDILSQDAARYLRLLGSPVAQRRIEGLQGLSHLKHWPAEEQVLELLTDPSPQVRREAVLALGRLGTGQCIPHLIALLDHPAWEVRQNAWLALGRLTSQSFGANDKPGWQKWWLADSSRDKEQALLARAETGEATARHAALRALRHLATPASETALIGFLHRPGLAGEDRNLAAEALERVGSARAIPALGGLHTDASAWALGRIGGVEAEAALLKFPKTLAVLLNLDRLHSTNAGPFIPHLVASMGLVTYRGQPDDVMNVESQPIQRVGANLIRRSGLAPELINQVLLELEYTSQAPPKTPRSPLPEAWRPMLEKMRSELKPGFVREDGVTTSQPLTALEYVATDRALARRLMPLLRHPAVVPRVYVAMTLGRLQAREALPEILGIIREGYPFSDAVALASGKHFDQSQTVRWRGFLCLALGRLGGEEARLALEQLAGDGRQPRDIRYSAVVGLGFIASPRSLPALRQTATNDIIWMVRDEARRTAADIELLQKENQP